MLLCLAEFSLYLSGRQVPDPWMGPGFLTRKWGYEVLSHRSVMIVNETPRTWTLVLVAFGFLEERVVILTEGPQPSRLEVPAGRACIGSPYFIPSPLARSRCSTSADEVGKWNGGACFTFLVAHFLFDRRSDGDKVSPPFPVPLTAPHPPLPAVGLEDQEAQRVVLVPDWDRGCPPR